MRRRLIHLVSELPPHRMLTLTVDTKRYDSPEQAASRMAWAFGKLIAKLRRRFPDEPTEYLAVWERTRQGWPHLHVLLRGPYQPQRVVSALWSSLTGSPVVWFTKLDGTSAGARYVAKYLTKDPDPFHRGRALRASRGFLIEPMRPQGRRFCTLGPVKVYRESVWVWLEEQLDQLRLIELRDDGIAAAVAWTALDWDDDTAWRIWSSQREQVRRREKPPPPAAALITRPLWDSEPEPEPGPGGA